MTKYKCLLVVLLLFSLPSVSATFIINNNTLVTNSTNISINVSGSITYNLIYDNNTITFNNESYFFNINNTVGYHNLSIQETIPNSTVFYIPLIYDIHPPTVGIQNLSSSTYYYYNQLPEPTILMSDPDNWGYVFIVSKTPILSGTGTHIFSVNVSDQAGRYTIASMNYTIASNTTANISQERHLLFPLMNTTINFTTSSPVNVLLTLPIGFTTPSPSYTNITSLNCTIRAGMTLLDQLVNVSLRYTDMYNKSDTFVVRYWIVGSKTAFYMLYDADYDSRISRKEVINATKNYYTNTTISPEQIREMVAKFKTNLSYLQ